MNADRLVNVNMQDAKGKKIEDVLILSGDHLYRMDYMDFVQVSMDGDYVFYLFFQQVVKILNSLHFQSHRQSGADITLSCLPMDDR